jgi:hypothetical protein
MSWQAAAAHAPGSTNSGLFDGGLSWGMVLIGIIALLALTAVCTFGVLARVRDRAADRKSLAALHQSTQPKVQTGDKGTGQSADSGGSSPATG